VYSMVAVPALAAAFQEELEAAERLRAGFVAF
jgi:hypothetical protein